MPLPIRTWPESGGQWIVAVGVLLAGSGAALYLHHVAPDALVFYGDAASHMVVARRVVDWADSPGLGQLGTSWLPLPHLLLLPFTVHGPLFTTGLAGAAVSLPCLALTSMVLYRMLRVHVAAPGALAAAGAFLYALNPSILYVGLTAMTEAPFMLFFVASAYFFLAWYARPDDLRAMALAALCAGAATMCRYEGWALPPFLAAVALWRLARCDLDTRRKVAGAALAFLSFAGIVLWVGYNAMRYGDPLEFANSEFYSAAAQAQARDIRETLLLQPANVARVYGLTALVLYGPILLAAALLGSVLRTRREANGTGVLLLYLALPPLSTLALLLAGIGEMNLWFNSRFLILLAPLLIVLAVMFLQARNSRALSAAGVLTCLAFYATMPAFDRVPTYLDARGGFYYQANRSAVTAGKLLESEYDGGKIALLTGSAQAHRLMVAAGIPLGQYDELLASNTGKSSYTTPWLFDRWVVLSKQPDSDGASAVAYWRERRDQLDEHYQRVHENEYHEILVLKPS